MREQVLEFNKLCVRCDYKTSLTVNCDSSASLFLWFLLAKGSFYLRYTSQIKCVTKSIKSTYVISWLLGYVISWLLGYREILDTTPSLTQMHTCCTIVLGSMAFFILVFGVEKIHWWEEGREGDSFGDYYLDSISSCLKIFSSSKLMLGV